MSWNDFRIDEEVARAWVAAWSERHSPEALAVVRAARGAHPYQQCLKANGCQHPCSCPIRNTSERNAP